jgi:tetratricopeptide (TPR) repeat protein
MALNSIGISLARMRKFDEAVQYIKQSLEIAISIQSSMGTWIAYANLQHFYYNREGKLQDSLEYANEMLPMPYIDNSPFLSMNFLRNKADILYQLGQYEASLQDLEEARKIAYHFAGPVVQVEHLLAIAMNHAELKNFEAAHEALEQVRSLSKKLERPNDAADLLVVEAEVSRRAWEAGNLQQIKRAQANVDQAIALLRGTNWLPNLALALQAGAWIALSANQPEKALEFSEESLQIYAAQPFAPYGHEYVHVCALWANGQDDAAEEYLERAYQCIMTVANQLRDENLRRSWLEDVYVNRQIIRDWALYHH